MVKRWRGVLLAAAFALPAVSFAQVEQSPSKTTDQNRQASLIHQRQMVNAINSRTPPPAHAMPAVERPLPLSTAFGCARQVPDAGNPIPVRKNFKPALNDSVLNQ